MSVVVVLAAALAGHLCAPGEAPVFSCAVAGSKQVSLCRQDDRLAYRFGRPGKVELVFPPAPAPARATFARRSTFGGPRVSTCQVAFANGGYRYALEQALFHDDNQQRLVVTKPDGSEREVPCIGDVVGAPCDVDGLLEDELLVTLRARLQTLEQALAAASCLSGPDRAARRAELDALGRIVSPHAAWRALEDDPMVEDDDQLERLAEALVCEGQPSTASPPPSPSTPAP